MKYLLNLLTVVCFGLVLSACAGSQKQTADSTPETPATEATEVAGTFGAEFTASDIVPANKILSPAQILSVIVSLVIGVICKIIVLVVYVCK